MTLDEAMAYLRATFSNVGDPVAKPQAQQFFPGVTAMTVRFLVPDGQDVRVPGGATILADRPFDGRPTPGDTPAFWEGRKPVLASAFRARMLSELDARISDRRWLSGRIVETDDKSYAVFQVEELVSGAATLKFYVARLGAGDVLELTESNRSLTKAAR